MITGHRVRRNRLHKGTALLSAALAATILLTACGSGDSEQSSEGGDSITLYTGRNTALIDPLIEQFTEDTGIEVEVRDGGSAELASQILTEGDASPADVFLSQDAGALGAVSKAGLFAELPAEITERVPEAYRAGDGTWVGTSGRVRTIVYNPELVAEPPTSIDGVLDPQYKGKIGFAPSNASFQAFVTGMRVLRGDDAAREWLEAFAAQEPVPFESNIAVRDAVDSGQISLGLVNHYYLYELIAEVGPDAVTARNQYLSGGDPGGLVNVAGAGVLATSGSSDDAEALVAYLVGPEGQKYFAEETFEYPLVTDVEASDLLPALSTLDPPQVDLSDLDSLEQTQAMLAEVGLLTK